MFQVENLIVLFVVNFLSPGFQAPDSRFFQEVLLQASNFLLKD